jgi:hypothetical protein
MRCGALVARFSLIWFLEALTATISTTGRECRGDLLDHVIVLNERHLKRLMNEYTRYYHEDRTHLGLEKQTPDCRVASSPPQKPCEVIVMPRLGGLHHRYDLAA